MKITLRVEGFNPVALSDLDEVAPALAQMRTAFMRATGSPLGTSRLTVGRKSYRVTSNGGVWDGDRLFHGQRFDGPKVRHGEVVE